MGFTHRNLSEQIFGSSRRHTMAHIPTIPHSTAQLRNLHISTNLSKPVFVAFGQKGVKGIFGILGTSPI